MYETFEHTADIGLRIRADDLGELFADAGRALFSLLVPNLDAVRAVEEVSFALEGDQLDLLLHDWLTELLYAFATRHVVLAQFTVMIDDGRLRGIARGEPFDPTRHESGPEVKAITYHGLKLDREDSGWLAEVIVDV